LDLLEFSIFFIGGIDTVLNVIPLYLRKKFGYSFMIKFVTPEYTKTILMRNEINFRNVCTYIYVGPCKFGTSYYF